MNGIHVAGLATVTLFAVAIVVARSAYPAPEPVRHSICLTLPSVAVCVAGDSKESVEAAINEYLKEMK